MISNTNKIYFGNQEISQVYVGSNLVFSSAWTPANLGPSLALWLDATDTDTVTVNGNNVSQWDDKSDNQLAVTQSVADQQPAYTTGEKVTFDRVNDTMTVTMPATTGTLVLATANGTAAYGVTIPAGSYSIGGHNIGYMPDGPVIGQIITNTAMSEADKSNSVAWLREKGGGDNYGAVTNFSNWWRNWTELTSFPLIDTSSGTDFNSTWRNCARLTSLPANFFDGCPATNFTNAFINTNLSQQSIDNILVSIESNGTSNGTFNQSGGQGVSATGQAAINALRGRGWTVTVTEEWVDPTPTYDADAQAYFERVEAEDGQTLEPAVKTAINDFVVGCKTDGIWDAIKASCILAGARTLSGALQPLVGTAPTNFNFVSGDYNRKTGLVGDGSTKYLAANLITAASNSHQAVYRTSGFQAGRTLIGCLNVNGSQGFRIGFQFSQNIGFMHASNTFPQSGLGAFAGHSRANLAGSFDWRVSPLSGSFTVAAYTDVTSSTAVFAEDRNGTSITNYSNARLSFYSIGEALDLTQLDTRVSNLITAIGAAIP